jgi:hypothetical protein
MILRDFLPLPKEPSPMTATDHAHPQPRRLPPLYVMFWGFLAAMALAYLVILHTRPEFATAFLPSADAMAVAQNDRTLARVATEINGVKQSVTSLQKDVGEVRTAFGVQDERIQSLTNRVATLETASHPTVAEAAPVAPPPSPAPTSTAAAASSPPSPPAAEEPPTTIAAKPEPQMEPPAAPIVTGALTGPPMMRKPAAPETPPATAAAPPPPTTPAAPPATTPTPMPAAKPAAVKAPISSGWATSSKSSSKSASKLASRSGPVAIRLSTGPSLDSLRLSWQLLVDENRPVLRTLLPRYVETGSDPSTFALIAGPIVSREEALRTCARLKARRVTCTISAYDGQPL